MQVIVDKHTVTIVKNEIVNEGEYNVQSCNFQFSSDYDGLPKIVIFKTGTVAKQIMLSGNTCITPEEVLQTTGIVGLGVYAYQTDGDNLTLRYSPTPAVFTVEPGSYDEGDAPTPPTPSVIEQLQEEITQNANNITSLENVTSTHTTQIGTLQTDVNNIKTEQITQNTNIQTNANDISNIKAEQITQNNNIQANADDITTLQNSLSNETTNRENTDINLQQQIDAITSSSDIVDIVGTYAQLMAYDTQHLSNNDVIKVLQDETHENAMTYYRWDKHNSQWIYIGQEAPYYTKSETDTLLQGKANVNDVYTKSQIDDTLEDYALKTDLTDFITEQEVDTKLNNYVDTTTYTQGQATQDTNIQNNTDSIEDIESLIEQMPTVSGQGTDISLQDVYNYRLIKLDLLGNSSQDSTTGKNLLNVDSDLEFTRSKTIQVNIPAGTYHITSTSATASDGANRVSIRFNNNNQAFAISNLRDQTVTLTTDETTIYLFSHTDYPSSAGVSATIKDLMISVDGGTYEPYTGGIPAPNPSYPFPVKVVTGENSLVISNSDNTETQTYPISLGNIELNSTPDGTIRDGIYGTPDNWKKKQFMQKIILNGSESYGKNTSGTGFISFTLSNYITSIDKDVSSNLFSNMLQSIASGNVANTCRIASSGRIVLTFSDTFCDYDLTALSTTLQTMYNNNNPVILYIPLATATDIDITDTTLIGQLNDIYNNAHSYNGVTNITTTYASGNEQMHLDIEALAKGGSSTAETDPIFSASASSGITSSDITNWNGKASTTYVDTAISNAITNTLGGSY